MVQEIRASTLSRVMKCLGPVTLQYLAENESGQAAADGTAVGELLTAMIHQRTPDPQVNRNASNGVFLDSDMWYYAREAYHQIMADAQGAEVTSEVRVDWQTKSGIIIRGQYDAAYIVATTLNVDDLKYGFGIHEVNEHWQTIAYAIGIAIRNPGLTHVRFTIRQPRAYHEDGPVRSKLITIDELWAYYHQIDARMTALVNGDRTLETGKHCKYCLGVRTCPAFIRASGQAVDFVMTDWKEKELTGDDIALQLQMFERAADIIKIKYESLKTLAISRLQSNQIINGYNYKVKYGDRAWREGVTAESLKALSGINALEEPKLMSPSKAEKAGINKKLVSQLVYKPTTGVELVKEDSLTEAQKVFSKPT